MSDEENSKKESPEQGAARHTIDTPRGNELDLLGGRYDIQMQTPLPEFSNDICNAYAAYDREEEYSNLYALVGVNTFPFRDRATEVMQKGTVPHLVRCHATGPVTLSDTKKTHRAFILQRPSGKKLSEIIKHSGALPEAFITKQIILPLSHMLAELEAHGINHGCINPDTIYYDKEITVSECCALPSGYLQKITYEASDRLISMRIAKGAGEASCDYYAIGILALHLFIGYLPNEKMEKDELYDTLITKGAYNSFIPEVDMSDAMLDLLRGSITENRCERWSGTQLKGWLSGKRYSIVAPSIPKDSVRPFDYRGAQYYTRQQIAYAFSKDWKMAKTQVSGFHLMRWLESNIKKTDVCDQVYRIIPIGDDDQPMRALKDDELSRLLTALDPQSPIRYQMVSLNVDGLGSALADAFSNGNAGNINQIRNIIELNLLQYADGLLENIDNPLNATMLWNVQGLRPILKAKGLGFGSERLLYQLNPALCCQNKILLPHYIYTLEDMLTTLENLAFKHAKDTPLVDKHIAAFITNRLEIEREIRVVELGSFPDLATDESLVMLKILTMAQQKAGNKPLPNITRWAVEMAMPTLDKLHQTSKRKKIKSKIEKLVDKGIIDRVAFLIFNKDMFVFDRREHSRAEALFRFHKEMLVFLSDSGKLRLKARIMGQQMAWFCSILVLGLAAYISSKPFI